MTDDVERFGKLPERFAFAIEYTDAVVLGREAVAEDEITAIPRLLAQLDRAGALVTIDAIGSQKDIAAQIVDQGGDYVLAVKENQPTLYADVQQVFDEVLSNDDTWMSPLVKTPAGLVNATEPRTSH